MANLNFIKKALPWIGTALQVALPGPVGNIAAILTSKLGKTVPSNAGSIADTIETALADPAQLAQLKAAEQQFQESMTAMGFQHETELEQIAAADRASARQREEVVKDPTSRNLAYLVVGVALGMCGYLISPWSKAMESAATAGFAGTVLGYAINEAKQVMTYYFGASSNADEKTDSTPK